MVMVNVECSLLLPIGGPVAQADWLCPVVGSHNCHMTLWCQVPANQINSTL